MYHLIYCSNKSPGHNLFLFLELNVCDWIAAGEENDEVRNDVALGHVIQLVLKCPMKDQLYA